jgi:hypothetical protein
MSVHAAATDLSVTSVLSPYAKFKMVLRSKEVKGQYPNLLEKFFDFCKFEGPYIEQKATKFYLFAALVLKQISKKTMRGMSSLPILKSFAILLRQTWKSLD